MATITLDINVKFGYRVHSQVNIVDPIHYLYGSGNIPEYNLRVNATSYSRNEFDLTFDYTEISSSPSFSELESIQSLNNINYALIKPINHPDTTPYPNSPLRGCWFVNDFVINGRMATLHLTKDILNTYWDSIKGNEEVIVATSDKDMIDKSLPNGNYIVKPEKEYKYVEIKTGFGDASSSGGLVDNNFIIEIVGL